MVRSGWRFQVPEGVSGVCGSLLGDTILSYVFIRRATGTHRRAMWPSGRTQVASCVVDMLTNTVDGLLVEESDLSPWESEESQS